MLKTWFKQLTASNLLLLTAIFFICAVLFLKARIIGDPFSTYAWVRSAIFDHDLNFFNEYTIFNADKNWTALAWPRELAYTKFGLLNNPFSIGPALLWTPAVLLAYMATYIANIFFNLFHLPALVNNGYSFYYHFLVSFWNHLLSIFGLYLIYLILTKYFSKKVSLLAVLGITFASAVFNYLYNEPASSHNTSLFVISLFYFLFLNFKSERRLFWFGLGLAGGLVFLVRWQQIIFLLPAVWKLVKGKNLASTFSFLLGFLPTISLQFLAWYLISGRFFYIPQGSGFVSLTGFLAGSPPNFIKILISANHGLFYWTPITFFGLVGLAFLSYKSLPLARWGLLIFTLSLIVNSNLADLYGGYSFSGRRFIEDSLFLALGLAGLINYFKANLKIQFLILLLAIWNILLVTQYVAHKIPGWGYLIFPDWIKNQFFAWVQLPYFIGHGALGYNLYFFFKERSFLFLIFALIILLFYLIGFFAYFKLSEKLTKGR